MRIPKNILLIIILLMLCSKEKPHLETEHECRFWGIIYSQDNQTLDALIREHLNSLRQLGYNNPDGWGMGYFISPASDTLLPVICRGEPEAPNDPRYLYSMEELISYTDKAAVAHVRRGSSGPTGIPNPHPFRRRCINRDFDMLFAHNGTISVEVLLRVINETNPFYIKLNPPDYSPNYLDSDLYSILLAEVMDTYSNISIEECIRRAVIKLDSALGFQSARMNFVMTDGKTIWALNFTKPVSGAVSVYYSPPDSISDYWVVASQPMDTSSLWIEIPNQTLVCLRPNEVPQLIPIYQKFETTKISQNQRVSFKPNPFKNRIEIDYYLSRKGFIEIVIYDETGRLVQVLFRGLRDSGEHKISWDGTDEHNAQLRSGKYFCSIKSGNEEKLLKLILIE